jgi:DNA helicase-2/ATP-dependent DNA helicase PcrA
MTHARTRLLYGGRDWNLPSRFLEEIPAELTDREEEAATPAPTPGAPAPQPGATFALGEDVVHAQFGEGVVIGVEPGGMVVVRFAGDGSERKLMADYAPLKKRG